MRWFWMLAGTRVSSPNYLPECSKSYSRPDHTTKVGRWRENLSAAGVAELVPLVAEVAGRFGYGLP